MDDGGDPFSALFLDQAALPVGMRRIHMVDSAPLLRPGSAARAVRSGTAIWLAEPDADLYRLDDSRWVMRSRRATAALFRDLSSQLDGIGRGVNAGTDSGRPAGRPGCITSGTPDGGFVHLARVGTVVIRVVTTPGDHASVARAVAECLGARAEARVAAVLAAPRARPLAGRMRRAWLLPDR